MVGLALCLLYLIEWRLCLFLKQRRSRPSLQKESPPASLAWLGRYSKQREKNILIGYAPHLDIERKVKAEWRRLELPPYLFLTYRARVCPTDCYTARAPMKTRRSRFSYAHLSQKESRWRPCFCFLARSGKRLFQLIPIWVKQLRPAICSHESRSQPRWSYLNSYFFYSLRGPIANGLPN